jgi:hypothetical protein
MARRQPMARRTTAMSGSGTSSGTPNQQLTTRIIAALKDAGLLTDKHWASAEQKLSSGKAKESDWRLWAEEIVLAKERADAEKHEN